MSVCMAKSCKALKRNLLLLRKLAIYFLSVSIISLEKHCKNSAQLKKFRIQLTCSYFWARNKIQMEMWYGIIVCNLEFTILFKISTYLAFLTKIGSINISCHVEPDAWFCSIFKTTNRDDNYKIWKSCVLIAYIYIGIL